MDRSKCVVEKTFDMSTKVSSPEPFELDLGKGIYLRLQLTIMPPDPEIHADLIRRDTLTVVTKEGQYVNFTGFQGEEEDGGEDGNPYASPTMKEPELKQNRVSDMKVVGELKKAIEQMMEEKIEFQMQSNQLENEKFELQQELDDQKEAY